MGRCHHRRQHFTVRISSDILRMHTIVHDIMFVCSVKHYTKHAPVDCISPPNYRPVIGHKTFVVSTPIKLNPPNHLPRPPPYFITPIEQILLLLQLHHHISHQTIIRCLPRRQRPLQDGVPFTKGLKIVPRPQQPPLPRRQQPQQKLQYPSQ